MSLSKFSCMIAATAMLTGCETTMTDGQKETIGTILGAVAGAVVGSQVGKGDGQLIAVATGTLAGAWLGNSVGQSLDEVDRMKYEDAAQDALENNSAGEYSAWNNPESGNYGRVTPTAAVEETATGEQCREYTSTVTIDGMLETINGMACRRPDGTWRTVD
ncbi:RT0821/Lpp0805 family surface protein [Terasakiella sp. A23]|uniref:RT0821/Lpp0805 family surface protein n=1 Tax=Terasakiella sp. FCG-A23 TaxID=3080561 RepID=UPI0029554E6B|nr:RT0821/Lpp0805 family surface protein [Terasakiella sp. A23]MDV7340113.1 RT0821/Lpp0805 family surface protein [Terasakiella sp. A23]